MHPVQGIHHITAIAGDPQRNLHFYHHILGQRLVKRTVNFDDPGTYHFYFGDRTGTPGTILTFFPWRHMSRGQRGNGEVAATAYSISAASAAFWRDRLSAHSIDVSKGEARFDAEVMTFEDPDGMIVELIVDDSPATFQRWPEGPIPGDHALRGFHSATLWVPEAQGTVDLLTTQLGYQVIAQQGARTRLQAGSQDIGRTIDLVERPGQPAGKLGKGSVHHIAYRTVDDAEQAAYLDQLRAARYQVSPVMDRQYFHSIYFRSPGGVLFEIATDAPGFLYDEPVAELGQNLKLPDWLESQRPRIESALPAIDLATLSGQGETSE